MGTSLQVVAVLLATLLWRTGNAFTRDSSKPLKDPVVSANINTPSRFSSSTDSSPLLINVGIAGRRGSRTISPFSTQLYPSTLSQPETEEGQPSQSTIQNVSIEDLLGDQWATPKNIVGTDGADDPITTPSSGTATGEGSTVETSFDGNTRVSDSKPNADGSNAPSPDTVDNSPNTSSAEAPTENESGKSSLPISLNTGAPLGSRVPPSESAYSIFPENPDSDLLLSEEQENDANLPKIPDDPEELVSEEQQRDANSPEMLIYPNAWVSEEQEESSRVGNMNEGLAPPPMTPQTSFTGLRSSGPTEDSIDIDSTEQDLVPPRKSMKQPTAALPSTRFPPAAMATSTDVSGERDGLSQLEESATIDIALQPQQDSEILQPPDEEENPSTTESLPDSPIPLKAPSIPSTSGSLTPSQNVASDENKDKETWRSSEKKEQPEGESPKESMASRAQAGPDLGEHGSTHENMERDELADECNGGCGPESGDLPKADPDSSKMQLERDWAWDTNPQPLGEPFGTTTSLFQPPDSETPDLANEHQKEPLKGPEGAESSIQGAEQPTASEDLLSTGSVLQLESDLNGNQAGLGHPGTESQLGESPTPSILEQSSFGLYPEESVHESASGGSVDALGLSELPSHGEGNLCGASPPNLDDVPTDFYRTPDIGEIDAAEEVPALKPAWNNPVLPESQKPVPPQHQFDPAATMDAELSPSEGPSAESWGIAPFPSGSFLDFEDLTVKNENSKLATTMDEIRSPPTEAKTQKENNQSTIEPDDVPPLEFTGSRQPISSSQANAAEADDEAGLEGDDRTLATNMAGEGQIGIVVASLDQEADVFEAGALPPPAQESTPVGGVGGNAGSTEACDDGSGRGPCKGPRGRYRGAKVALSYVGIGVTAVCVLLCAVAIILVAGKRRRKSKSAPPQDAAF